MKKKTILIQLTAALAVTAELNGCSLPVNRPESSLAQETMENTVEMSVTESDTASVTEPATSAPDVKQDGSGPLYPVTEPEYAESRSEDGILYATGYYPQISIRNTGYEKLSGALESWNRQVKTQTRQAVDEYGGLAGEQFDYLKSSGGEADMASLPYEWKGSVKIMRADADVFSLRYDVSSYTGGTHGNHGVIGVQFDSQTGEQLLLEDIISDRDALYAYLIDALEERYGVTQALFEGYEQTVEDEVFENETDGYRWSLNWTMGADGITVYFEEYEIAPYAAGLLTVQIPCAGNETMFRNGGLFEERRMAAVPVGLYETMYVDLNGDGQPDELYVSEADNESDYDKQICVQVNGAEVSKAGGYGISAAYLMKKEGSPARLYVETVSDNDYRILSVFDLSRETPVYEGDYGEGSFYGNVPADPDDFYLSERLDVLSTYIGHRRFRIGEGAMPEPLEPFYTMTEGLEVTAKQAVPAFCSQKPGEPCQIPEGQTVTIYRTDGKSWVDLKADSGEIYRVNVNPEWPQTIGGIEIEAYFEGLRFAG